MKRNKIIYMLVCLMLVYNTYSQNSSPALAQGAERFINKPKLIRGPYLVSASDTSMIIRWRTDASSRSRVRYGTDPGRLNNVQEEFDLVTEHQIKLQGLSPGTKYFYSIGTLKDTLQFGPDNYFSTLPKPGSTGLYRVGVFGDCGYLSVNQEKVRDQFLEYLGTNDMNAWILLGDNAYNDGNDMEYQAKFFKPYQDHFLKKYPVFPAPGNHDYHDADFGAEYAQTTHNTSYFQNFSMPINGESGGVSSRNPAFYSFDLGNIHFISLDSYGIEENQYFLYDTLGPQIQWLKKDLVANKNKGWVIAYWHHPPYSKGTHDSDTDGIMSKIRENVVDILERSNVDLIICGHSHVYERPRLMNGHLGNSSTFDHAKHNLSNSSGLYDGSKNSAPYIKENDGKGTVYIVSGSSAYVGNSKYEFQHKAMYYSNDTFAGAGILEVFENRLDFKWICGDGVIRDQFTMMKDVNKKNVLRIKAGENLKLTASFITDSYSWNKSTKKERTIEVSPKRGKTIYTVKDQHNSLQDVFEVIVTN